MIEAIQITDRDSWLAMRRQDVTASVAGCLLGVHDYTTAFELWGEKTGQKQAEHTEDLDEDDPLLRGQDLEPVAIKRIGRRFPEWKLETPGIYLRDPDTRTGCTPDLFAYDTAGRKINVQIKTTADLIFKQKWRDPDTREIEVPLWIAVQSMLEAEFGECDAAYVALLVVGMGLKLHMIEIPIHKPVLARVHEAIAEFWKIADSGKPMPPDFARDGAAIARIFAEGNEPPIDLSGDNRFAALVEERAGLKEAEKAAKAKLEEVEAEIKFKLGNSSLAVCGNRTVSWKLQKRGAYQVKASEFRVLRVA